MKKYFTRATLLLASLLIVMASCTKPTTNTPVDNNPPVDTLHNGGGDDHGGGDDNAGGGDNNPGNGTGNSVTGFVRDTHGNPVAGADVRALNHVFNNWIETTTDAQGRYKIEGIIEGGWNIYAWKDAEYEGKLYHLRMGMEKEEDYNPFAGNPGAAVVKNFVWQLDGEIPDRPRNDLNSSGWFGGSITFKTLDINFNDLGEGTVVTVTCTPMPGATLFDGSPATTIVRQFTSHITSPATWVYLIHDIPQSVYSLSATCVMNGQTKRVMMGWDIDEATHNNIDNFSFKPSGMSHGDYESGIMTQNDNPIYMMVE